MAILDPIFVPARCLILCKVQSLIHHACAQDSSITGMGENAKSPIKTIARG